MVQALIISVQCELDLAKVTRIVKLILFGQLCFLVETSEVYFRAFTERIKL